MISLSFCRPGQAPSISCKDLANFFEHLENTGLLRPEYSVLGAKVKTGKRLNANMDPRSEWKENYNRGMRSLRFHAKSWDLEWNRVKRRVVIDDLRSWKQSRWQKLLRRPDTVYRANFDLGSVSEEVVQAIHLDDDSYWNG